MTPYHLTIVSANGKAFDGDIESLVLPGVDGDFGILAAHTPLIAALRQGLAKITRDGREVFFMVGEGYVDVAKNHASVIVGNAISVKDGQTGQRLLKEAHPWAAAEALLNA